MFGRRIAVGAAAMGLAAAFVGATVMHVRAPAERPCVEGWAAPRDVHAWDAWLQALSERAESREILLRAEGESIPVTLAALGYRVDQQQTRAHLTSGVVRSPDVTLIWSHDPRVARETLSQLAHGLNEAPQNAWLNFVAHERGEAATGRTLNIEASLAAVNTLDPRRLEPIVLTFDITSASVHLTDLPAVDPRKVLARFETDFRKKRGPRVHNIRTAARYLNGTIVPPGAVLSFNRTVGHRVAERGFIDAPVIVNDELESGMGGGVCQVATTLHGAAVYGALEVKERRSHSRPSGYAPLGLDATVIDNVQDLKLRNPYDVPLYVRAYRPSRYVIRVELLGMELPGEVSHKYWVVQRHDYTRRVIEKTELPPGTVKQRQKGSYGYDTVSRVVLTRDDGTRSERSYRSKYYPVPEVLWIGPGTRADDLPPLPKGAEVATPSGALHTL